MWRPRCNNIIVQNPPPPITQPIQNPIDTSEVPCNQEVKSGGQGFQSYNHSLGTKPGIVTIEYNTQSIPDEIRVLYNGSLVTSTNGLVKGEGKLSFQYNAKQGSPDFCTVEIEAPEDQTAWSYRLNCPQ